MFEDTFDQWLAEFHKYLAYDNPALAEPDKPSIVDQARPGRVPPSLRSGPHTTAPASSRAPRVQNATACRR